MSWISRHQGTAAAVAVVGLGAMALGACGQPSDEQQADVIVGGRVSPDESAGAVVARASQSTTAVESGRVRMSYTMSGSERGEAFDLTMSGDGSFTDFGNRSQMTVQTTGAPGIGLGNGSLSLGWQEIVDGTVVYMKTDLPISIPGMGDTWTRFDLADLPGGAGAANGQMGGLGSSWGGFLDSLEGVGDTVVEAGTDTVDGDAVTVYKGVIDPAAAIAEAAPDDAADVESALGQLGDTLEMPFTAWVDGDGLIRKLAVDVSGDFDGTTMNVTMTIELYDLGAPITIELPPADQVGDGGFPGLDEVLGPETHTA